MKSLFLFAALTLAAVPAAYAQNSATGSAMQGQGMMNTISVGVATGGPASGAVAAASTLGTLANPQAIVGQTTGGNSVSTVDACLKPYNYTLGPGAITGAEVIKLCWALRIQQAIATIPPGSPGYEALCTPDSATDNMFLEWDWRSGRMGCADNRAKLAKANASDPRLGVSTPAPVQTVAAQPPRSTGLCPANTKYDPRGFCF